MIKKRSKGLCPVLCGVGASDNKLGWMLRHCSRHRQPLTLLDALAACTGAVPALPLAFRVLPCRCGAACCGCCGDGSEAPLTSPGEVRGACVPSRRPVECQSCYHLLTCFLASWIAFCCQTWLHPTTPLSACLSAPQAKCSCPRLATGTSVSVQGQDARAGVAGPGPL